MIDPLRNYSRLLTPPGAGAIAVIRIEGPDALKIVARLITPNNCESNQDLPANRLFHRNLYDADEVIDDIVLSLCGDHQPEAVDVCTHGGIRIVERALQTLERMGAPLADESRQVNPVWPAANTLEREALNALSLAKTERAVRFLLWQRKHLASQLRSVGALWSTDAANARSRLKTIADGFSRSRTLIDGATVAIIGPPNSGKSTLFNRLIGRDAAIVSPTAGTTRDWIAEPIEISGVPITLIDTAGARFSTDFLEQEAIRLGRQRIESAHLALFVIDGSRELTEETRSALLKTLKSPNHLIFVNKSDQSQRCELGSLGLANVVHISAVTGDRMTQLVEQILRELDLACWSDQSANLFTVRQREIVDKLLSAPEPDIALVMVSLNHLIDGPIGESREL